MASQDLESKLLWQPRTSESRLPWNPFFSDSFAEMEHVILMVSSSLGMLRIRMKFKIRWWKAVGLMALYFYHENIKARILEAQLLSCLLEC